MRLIMTRAELAAHELGQHGRDYRLSDDGYDDMEVAAKQGWTAVSGWGRDGWDLGDWPFVVISVRDRDVTPADIARRGRRFEMRQTVEGDTTVYAFQTPEDRAAAIDYLFVWYGIGREYDEWAVNGLGAEWSDETRSYRTRDGLDAGTLRVPERFRGPFSWAQCDAEVDA